jgi:hypothetical protein
VKLPFHVARGTLAARIKSVRKRGGKVMNRALGGWLLSFISPLDWESSEPAEKHNKRVRAAG